VLLDLPDEAWVRLQAYAQPPVQHHGGPATTGDPVIDELERQLFAEGSGG
jgi:hypothetical protein